MRTRDKLTRAVIATGTCSERISDRLRTVTSKLGILPQLCLNYRLSKRSPVEAPNTLANMLTARADELDAQTRRLRRLAEIFRSMAREE